MDESGLCQAGTSGFASNCQWILGVLFMPTVYFLQNAVLIVCATGVGAWYFHHDDANKPSIPAKVGLIWAFTVSAGASYFVAVVNYIVSEIRRQAKGSMKYACCCFPHKTLCAFIFCAIQGCVQAYTRYMLIAHTFHGGSIRTTATVTFNILKNRLGEAMVNDLVSKTVMDYSSGLFSIGFAFIAWAWIDDAMGVGLLVNQPEWWTELNIPLDIVILFLVFIMKIFVLNPIFTLIFLALFGAKIKLTVLLGFLGGTFVGSICCLFFRFCSNIVLCCADTMFYAYALEAEAGQKQERFKEVYECIESNIVVGVPVTGPDPETGVAQGEVAQGSSQPHGKENMEHASDVPPQDVAQAPVQVVVVNSVPAPAAAELPAPATAEVQVGAANNVSSE